MYIFNFDTSIHLNMLLLNKWLQNLYSINKPIFNHLNALKTTFRKRYPQY